MQRAHKRLGALSLVLALGSSAAFGVATGCSGDESTSATPTTTTSSDVGTFKPTGCEFSVNTRLEYTDFARGRPESAPQPNIRRVRLGLGGNVAVGAAGRADPSSSFGVAWQTDDGTFASEVTWGKTPDPASWPKENRASGVTWLTPPGTINDNGPQRMHEAYVCGLTAATTYYYRVGGGAPGAEVWSEVYGFTTTPGPKSEVTIAAMGDSRSLGGVRDTWRLLQRKIHTISPTVQLFAGDMITWASDQGEWETWLDKAWKDEDQSLLTLGQTLTLAAHGNHDNHNALYFGNLTLPQDTSTYPDYAELFYSVDVGPVHIIALDDAWIVSQSKDPGYAKVLGDWLEADLSAAQKNRANVPWIIATHHHAEYSSSNHGEDSDVLRGRKFFTPIWDKFKVDMLLVSHDHNYERTKPLTGPAETPTIHADPKDGTVYVVCAGAGAPAYSKGTSDFTALSHDYKDGPALGLYCVLNANQSSLTLNAYELRADGSDPVFDTFTITK
jgi:hypothetical protein